MKLEYYCQGGRAPTINWHMSRLMEGGIVMGIREGKTLHYFIKDPESLINSLRNYFPTIWSKLSDKFANLFIQISTGRKRTST